MNVILMANLYIQIDLLTHWSRDNLADISQVKISTYFLQ